MNRSNAPTVSAYPEGQPEQDGVPGRDVGDRDAVAHRRRPTGPWARRGRPSGPTRRRPAGRARRSGGRPPPSRRRRRPPGRVRPGAAGRSPRSGRRPRTPGLGDGEGGGAVEPAAQEDDGTGHGVRTSGTMALTLAVRRGHDRRREPAEEHGPPADPVQTLHVVRKDRPRRPATRPGSGPQTNTPSDGSSPGKRRPARTRRCSPARDRTRAGRRPDCSCPTCGSKSIKTTSPRSGT